VLLERAIDVGVPLAAIALVGGALRHASNLREQIVGALAAAGVISTWVIHLRWRQAHRRKLASPSREWIEASVHHHEREERVAVFLCAILAFELSFLIPWWAGGIRLHATHPLAPIAVLTFWLPIAAITSLAAWAIVLWRRASRSLPQHRRTATELSEEEN
jgi:hypothetical protein